MSPLIRWCETRFRITLGFVIATAMEMLLPHRTCSVQDSWKDVSLKCAIEYYKWIKKMACKACYAKYHWRTHCSSWPKWKNSCVKPSTRPHCSKPHHINSYSTKLNVLNVFQNTQPIYSSLEVRSKLFLNHLLLQTILTTFGGQNPFPTLLAFKTLLFTSVDHHSYNSRN